MSSIYSLDPRAPATPACWEAVRTRLEALRRDILAEIQHYPTPIAHCDQQFNGLLEERDRVSAELDALEGMQRRASQAPPWDAVRYHLERARRRILAEIQHYPTPIAHCDQQFNGLLEERDRLSADLDALERLREHALAALDAFVQSSEFVAAARGNGPRLGEAN